jgi:HlyD family secretion protein
MKKLRLVPLALVAVPFVAFRCGSTDNRSGNGFLFEPAKRASISSSIEATGTVEAVSEVEVGSAVSGLIDKVFVSFNDTVTAGQPLVQLDRAAFKARASAARAALRVASALAEVQRSGLHQAELAIAAAEAERRSAEAQAKAAQARRDEADLELQRKLQLGRSGAATEREVSQARTARETSEADLRVALEQIELKADAIEIARADAQMALANVKNVDAVVEEKQATLDEAEAELEHTVIRAPFDGIVISREVSPGQAVAAGLETKTLFRIARDLGEMEVRGSIDEADIGLVREGEEAEFSVDAYPNRVFRGRVIQVRKSPEVLQKRRHICGDRLRPEPRQAALSGDDRVAADHHKQEWRRSNYSQQRSPFQIALLRHGLCSGRTERVDRLGGGCREPPHASLDQNRRKRRPTHGGDRRSVARG